jgi:hypothetical protein
MHRLLPAALVFIALAVPLAAPAQTAAETGRKSEEHARATLETMVQALGGEAWLKQQNQICQGRVASFFQNEPTGGTTDYVESRAWPDQERIEYGKRRDVAQFYLGRAGWEITYKGKTPLPQEQVDEYLRRRDHSIENVIKLWLNDPKAILMDQGQHLIERHLADQVTLISAGNEAVTLWIDAESHLPLRRSFEWRDPVYKDKNLDAEEYDDYHAIDGINTPFTITRYKNGEMTRQFFLVRTSYNQPLPADFWSVEAAERRIRK